MMSVVYKHEAYMEVILPNTKRTSVQTHDTAQKREANTLHKQVSFHEVWAFRKYARVWKSVCLLTSRALLLIYQVSERRQNVPARWECCPSLRTVPRSMPATHTQKKEHTFSAMKSLVRVVGYYPLLVQNHETLYCIPLQTDESVYAQNKQYYWCGCVTH